MLTRDHIEDAVRGGVISATQRDDLLALAGMPAKVPSDPASGSTAAQTAPATGDEDLRLVGGGNDLFVTIGVLLLTFGAGFALTPLVGADSPMLSVILAAGLWAIAEIVTRQKRMRLSSTVLAVMFMLIIAALIAHAVETRVDFAAIAENPLTAFGLRGTFGWVSAASAAAFVAAAMIYFWRFRVPVLAALIALAATGLAFTQTALFLYDGVAGGTVAVPTLDQVPDVLRNALYMPLACGLLIFGIAVTLDLGDRERKTIWSDCAFWLHVVSAPLLVHPLFIMATGQEVAFGEIKPGMDAVVGLVVLIVVFTYVALIIDRRSLLVPTLAYFGSLGVANLVNDAALGAGIPPVALVLIAVGGLIILFGAGWQRIRKAVMGATLTQRLRDRLPPVLL
jgi:hypothetical protein